METKANLAVVHSMYWDNIDKKIIDGQKRVFEFLGVPLIQHAVDRVPHGEWMDRVVCESSDNDVIIFCDIDAFPLNLSAYERSEARARSGGIFGLAQYSNHKPTQFIYAGPMFMAFCKKTWRSLGEPSLKRTKSHDSAEALTIAARSANVLLELVNPTCCLAPKWALKDQGVFGIATFYGERDFFHLFEARQPNYHELFLCVVDDVVSGRPLRFDQYLDVISRRDVSTPSIWKRIFGK